MKDILQNPIEKDIIYQLIQRLLKDKKRQWHLGFDNSECRKIESSARKRFLLGFPPGKDNDRTMCDAVNWEWILHCANDSRSGIIIVSRDTDYGISLGNDLLSEITRARSAEPRTAQTFLSCFPCYPSSGLPPSTPEIAIEDRAKKLLLK